MRILKKAKKRGFIEKVRPVLDQLVTAGMYMGEALYQDFLNKMGETK